MPTLEMPAPPERGESPHAIPDRPTLHALLADLYVREIERASIDAERDYLASHQTANFIRDQVRTAEWYRPHLPPTGKILDWGCRHAPDSCLLRAVFADRYELHGCDLWKHGRYSAFHDYADFNYRQITNALEIPYEDNTFDVVIAAGVLEHVALEYDSLRQLYRVLKPEGKLIIYYLPNKFSLQEWYMRVIRKKRFHRRLYGLSAMRETLKRFGLLPIESSYHNYYWDKRLRIFGDRAWVRALERTLVKWFPLRLLCDNLRYVAVKMRRM